MVDDVIENQLSKAVPDPVEVLYAFIKAMNQWERESYPELSQILPESGHVINQRLLIEYEQRKDQKLKQIFSMYCTPRERPYGRQGTFRHPPEYDPEGEKLLEVVKESNRRVVIFTEETTGFCHKNRYVLLRKSGEWRLDSKKWLDHEGNWLKHSL